MERLTKAKREKILAGFHSGEIEVHQTPQHFLRWWAVPASFFVAGITGHLVHRVWDSLTPEEQEDILAKQEKRGTKYV